MSSLFSSFMTDKTAEQAGIWVTFDEVVNDDGTTPAFLISRISTENRAYMNRLQSVQRRFNGKEKNMKADDIILFTDEMVKLFCDTVLLDWRDVKHDAKRNENGEIVVDKNGCVVCEELTYSKPNSIELLRSMPQLFSWLSDQANDYQNFLSTKRSENLKN